MITDEQIKQLAVSCGFKLTNETGDDLKPYVYEFARDLIALAQQVKPLKFDRSIYTAFGLYEIHPEAKGWLFYLDGYSDSDYLATEAEAIAAANADFKQRVLGCLVHGGDK